MPCLTRTPLPASFAKSRKGDVIGCRRMAEQARAWAKYGARWDRAWSERLRWLNSAICVGAIVLAVGCNPSGDSLMGTWSGEDHTGARISLGFERDGRLNVSSPGEDLSAPAGVRVMYSQLAEVEPHLLYMKLFKGDELVEKVPFAIYKFEAGKLVVCLAKEFRTTMAGIPLGSPRYEFPREFTGACFALERQESACLLSFPG